MTLTLPLVARIGLVILAAMAWLGSPSLAAATRTLPPAPISRTVEIDGRFVTVKISVLRVIPGNIPEYWSGPGTFARVELSIQDGAPLPEGLTATRVRFEKLRGTGNRIFRAPLAEIPVVTDDFELDARGYQADISAQSRGLRRLKATVRLELDGRAILVPMGTVPISLAGITQ